MAAKCVRHARKVQRMHGLAEEAKSLPARVAEIEKASKAKVAKARAKRRTAAMDVVAV